MSGSKTVMSADIGRRRLLGAALAFGSPSLRALITGLPLGFITQLKAQTLSGQYLILSHGGGGDPLNANAPGCYGNPAEPGDPRHLIDHPPAADFATGHEVMLGRQRTLAAAPWGELDAGLRARLGIWHHATFVNAHPDFDNVRRFNGAIRAEDGAGTEELGAFVASQTALGLGTLQRESITVGGDRVQAGGREKPMLRPRDLKNLFAANIANIDKMMALRDRFVDRVYREVKTSGTPAERQFMDRYALSLSEAKQLGASFGQLLSEVQGNTPRDQARVAAALIKLQITPVVTMLAPFGGDNHEDADLTREAAETRQSLSDINGLWGDLNTLGIAEQTTFATLNVFGRTLKRNSSGGRNHNEGHHVMVAFGPHIVGGVMGGLEPVMRNNQLRDFRATAIRAGGATIAFSDTLSSVGKTLAAAVGVDRRIINERIAGGTIVASALS